MGQVLDEILRDGYETRSAVVAFRLLMLTGCRLSEIQKLRWEHVDLDAGELHLPDAKTGAVGRCRLRTIGRAAAPDPCPAHEDNPWVIAGKKPGSHLTDLQHPWRRIRARADLDDVRIHDLRHSFASRALALGEGLPMIGSCWATRRCRPQPATPTSPAIRSKRPAARIGDSIDGDLDAIAIAKRGSPPIAPCRIPPAHRSTVGNPGSASRSLVRLNFCLA